MTDAIGGYFELELHRGQGEYITHGLRVQSGRAALLAALPQLQSSRMWIPWYICECIPDAVLSRGIVVERYALECLGALPDISLSDGDSILYVNYFGLFDRESDAFLKKYPRGSAIVDASQAFFYKPASEESLVFYSPRKFFGVPDGGYLTARTLPAPGFPEDTESLERVPRLIRRLAGDVDGGYASYQTAEASLSNVDVRTMSQLTRRILMSIDYRAVASSRRANFEFLHAALGDVNLLRDFPGDPSHVPLCYPLLLERPVSHIRTRLAAKAIFIPTYWPELTTILPIAATSEYRWVTSLLTIPCDQRYTPTDLRRVVDEIVRALRQA